MVMNDLIGELEKAELIGDLVCSSFLHDVIDEGVSLDEWMDGRKTLCIGLGWFRCLLFY